MQLLQPSAAVHQELIQNHIRQINAENKQFIENIDLVDSKALINKYELGLLQISQRLQKLKKLSSYLNISCIFNILYL